VRLFLGKSRVEVSCPVYTRSENAVANTLNASTYDSQRKNVGWSCQSDAYRIEGTIAGAKEKTLRWQVPGYPVSSP
jgi:hypothetical protein